MTCSLIQRMPANCVLLYQKDIFRWSSIYRSIRIAIIAVLVFMSGISYIATVLPPVQGESQEYDNETVWKDSHDSYYIYQRGEEILKIHFKVKEGDDVDIYLMLTSEFDAYKNGENFSAFFMKENVRKVTNWVENDLDDHEDRPCYLVIDNKDNIRENDAVPSDSVTYELEYLNVDPNEMTDQEFIMTCGFMAGFLILDIYLAVWTYRDSRSRDTNGAMWSVVVFIFSILGFLVYIVMRPAKLTVPTMQAGGNPAAGYQTMPQNPQGFVPGTMYPPHNDPAMMTQQYPYPGPSSDPRVSPHPSYHNPMNTPYQHNNVPLQPYMTFTDPQKDRNLHDHPDRSYPPMRETSQGVVSDQPYGPENQYQDHTPDHNEIASGDQQLIDHSTLEQENGMGREEHHYEKVEISGKQGTLGERLDLTDLENASIASRAGDEKGSQDDA